MSVRTRLTEQDRAVCALKEQGFDVPAIAKTLRMSKPDVRKALERGGLNRPDASAIRIGKAEEDEAKADKGGRPSEPNPLSADAPPLEAPEPDYSEANRLHLLDLKRAHRHPALCPSLAPFCPASDAKRKAAPFVPVDITAALLGDPAPGRAWPDGRIAG